MDVEKFYDSSVSLYKFLGSPNYSTLPNSHPTFEESTLVPRRLLSQIKISSMSIDFRKSIHCLCSKFDALNNYWNLIFQIAVRHKMRRDRLNKICRNSLTVGIVGAIVTRKVLAIPIQDFLICSCGVNIYFYPKPISLRSFATDSILTSLKREWN